MSWRKSPQEVQVRTAKRAPSACNAYELLPPRRSEYDNA
jgi:hypothetical protein